MNTHAPNDLPEAIALIGMAGRFPGAANLDVFWDNLVGGVESISFLSDEQLLALRIDPALIRHPAYVKARGVLQDADMFDAAFFGFTPREAETMDPQHRVLLECAWHALEHAGYCGETFPGLIGVYAGVGLNTYLLSNLIRREGSIATIHSLGIGNDKDFLTTRISHKLDLRGPSMVIQTSCSTSLVAVHVACQNLLNYECDMALAGGVSIGIPQAGYFYQEGGIFSPDGHCRSFDARAQGTVGGNGVGVVVLRRLSDALNDGDTIYAVIRGSAVNNDGGSKVSYAAPSVQGQAAVIAEALAVAQIDPESVGYVETHGTGTALGDPIEVRALTEAFQARTSATGFCGIGSLKPNIGHLDAAAGVANLLKVTLALVHRQIPPSINFEQPNPQIDFSDSPFFVNTALRAWPRGPEPRRAGVSSFGIGGTNAHVIVEEAPDLPPRAPDQAQYLLLLSARIPAALDRMTANLAEWLAAHPEAHLGDVAYTLQVGRKALRHRRAVVGSSARTLAAELLNPQSPHVMSGTAEVGDLPMLWLFPGQGAQYPGMAAGLYQRQPTFRSVVDRCAELLRPHLGLDIRTLLFEGAGPAAAGRADGARLDQTQYTQPALFVVEYALAQVLLQWHIKPQAMLGHSIGEYVAACLAGVFSLEDALALVAARGRLMQRTPPGRMLSVLLPEEQILPLLGPDLSLAAINGPSFCAVSGSDEAVVTLERALAARGVEFRPLHTSHAFHSSLMDPILDDFALAVRQVRLSQPTRPYISNVTGTWITPEQATSPAYWVQHLRQPVRFADGLRTLLELPSCVLLEVGPGRTLSTLVNQQPAHTPTQVALTTIRHPKDTIPDDQSLLQSLGRLWLLGYPIDWAAFSQHEQHRRIALPGYPFERQRYWIEDTAGGQSAPTDESTMRRLPDPNQWLWLPSWKRFPALPGTPTPAQRWLLLLDQHGLGQSLAERLRAAGHRVSTVTPGPDFACHAPDQYQIAPDSPQHYRELLAQLQQDQNLPQRVVLLWPANDRSAESDIARIQAEGLYSLLYLTQALQSQAIAPVDIAAVSSGLHDITGLEPLSPARRAMLGLAWVVPQEVPGLTCRSIDLAAPPGGDWGGLADQLATELLAQHDQRLVAYRGPHRWVEDYEPLDGAALSDPPQRLRQGGVYMITGGLGKIGLRLAEELGRRFQAKLVLLGSSAFPAREDWPAWLRDHPATDPLSVKIQRLQAIEQVGGAVLALRADIADPAALRSALEHAQQRFGTLNGVFHCAGVTGEHIFRSVKSLTPADYAIHFPTKLTGVQVLAEALQGQPLDFCVLQSSLSAILGNLGFGAYAAANSAMDGWVAQRSRLSPTPWISINWDGWRFAEDGLADLSDLNMTADEGVGLLVRLLDLKGTAQVIVSTARLPLRLRALQQIALPPVKAAGGGTYARPALATAYVEPETPVQQAIVEIWQSLLGVSPIGIHDNFFELGGHSLLATQITARLRETFPVMIPLREMLDAPTVAQMADLIELALIEKLEQLSDEEIAALL